MANWQEILAGNADEAKKPEPMPQGTYSGVITKYEFKEAKNDKQTPFIRFGVRLLTPCEDVDMAEFAAFGGTEKLAKRENDYDFYMTEDSRYRLTDFMRDGLGLNVTGRGWTELLAETPNKPGKFYVSKELEKRPPNAAPNWTPRTFTKITDYAKVEAGQA